MSDFNDSGTFDIDDNGLGLVEFIADDVKKLAEALNSPGAKKLYNNAVLRRLVEEINGEECRLAGWPRPWTKPRLPGNVYVGRLTEEQKKLIGNVRAEFKKHGIALQIRGNGSFTVCRNGYQTI